MTETQAIYLGKILATANKQACWIRESGKTWNLGTGARIPEPTWYVLINNGWVTVQTTRITVTEKGQAALDSFYEAMRLEA